MRPNYQTMETVESHQSGEQSLSEIHLEGQAANCREGNARVRLDRS